MEQLTLRGFDRELRRRILQLARERGVSLNKAALLLLRRGAGLAPEPEEGPKVVGTGLDDLIGSWSEEEEREVLDAVEAFETVDELLWR